MLNVPVALRRSGVKRLVHAVWPTAQPGSVRAVADPPGLASDLKRLFPDGVTTVFDVGAYKGEFAALIHGAFPAARVWCFEPFPASYQGIVTRFAGQSWVRIENYAMSSQDGTAELMIGADLSTNSIVSPVVNHGAFATDVPRIPVPVRTLSQCATELLGDQASISILKVDTEGNDLRVLEGGEDLLRAGRIDAVHAEVMFIEHFKGAPGFLEIGEYLQRFKYRLYSLYDLKRNPQGQLRYGNALFISPARQPFAGVAR
jgi:FkbM family methyltransferase